ncbi:hypothetical protein COCSUDRAFT_63667 [Coccomyxa subellipsoidea C-169]|uniref:Uncharacterized protein n=1 Tax=Coccomyxa subellipsoidea (strain C-169) TaxID=574566 RepID=I0YY44_COCSC|nr:hypothetical protein COCSUDRAFT_63667 [Coccomyxa subellipsoidea C-169]EIE23313.1 hypothetical protein COCSUDRAFT_63667 [Coccomyxa subellipsoidea C-169]|eukprot:XP_005647857.1 hypothetical protein COCSUDRAFT_63667 [Coccomyxa subellipsoidea C-169]
MARQAAEPAPAEPEPAEPDPAPHTGKELWEKKCTYVALKALTNIIKALQCVDGYGCVLSYDTMKALKELLSDTLETGAPSLRCSCSTKAIELKCADWHDMLQR